MRLRFYKVPGFPSTALKAKRQMKKGPTIIQGDKDWRQSLDLLQDINKVS